MVQMCCQKQTVQSLLVFDLSSPLFVYSTEKIMYHLKLQHTVCTTWNYNIRFEPPETTTYGLWGFKLMSSSSERLSIEQWTYVDCNTVHFLLPSFLYVHFYLILHFTHGIYQCENQNKNVNELINNLSTVSYLIIYHF